MSKHETPLTRRYWEEVGGTLLEEFPAVRKRQDRGKRLLDAVILPDGPNLTAKAKDIEITDQNIVIVQTKAYRLGMYLLGQALFSIHLMEPFLPKSIQSVAICTKGDAVLEPLAQKYGIKVVIYPD